MCCSSLRLLRAGVGCADDADVSLCHLLSGDPLIGGDQFICVVDLPHLCVLDLPHLCMVDLPHLCVVDLPQLCVVDLPW